MSLSTTRQKKAIIVGLLNASRLLNHRRVPHFTLNADMTEKRYGSMYIQAASKLLLKNIYSRVTEDRLA